MRRVAPTLLLVWFLACDSGGAGCTDCTGTPVTPYPDPPPAGGELQSHAVRARLTQNLLEFLRTHLPSLVGSFFTVENGQAIYYLDETLFNPSSDPFFLRDACIGPPVEPCANRDNPAAEIGATYPSKISLDLDDLARAIELDWLEPNSDGDPGIRLSIKNFELFVDLALVINIPDFTGVAACHVQSESGMAAVEVQELSFDLRLGIDESGARPTIQSSVEESVVYIGDAADDSILHLQVSPCMSGSDPVCDDPRCYGAWGPFEAPDCIGVCGLLDLFSQLGGFLTQVLRPMLDTLGPSLADAVSQALTGALEQVPLEIETSFNVADLGGEILSEVQPIHLKIGASKDLDIRGTGPGFGLDLGLDGGATVPNVAACALDAAPPPLEDLGGDPPDYSGFVEVYDDTEGTSHFEAYHLAAAVSEAMVAQVFWSAFQSGILCVTVDSFDILALTNGEFALAGATLMDFDARLVGLTEPATPLIFGLQATTGPSIRLGAGRMVGTEIQDPLVEIILDDVALNIYMFIDDQFMRITGIMTDLVIRMGVERTPEHALQVVLDEVSLVDTRQLYNELAPAADLSGLLELIIDIVTNQFLADSLRFEINLTNVLSDALGTPLYMRLNALRRDLGPTDAAYLSVFATLCDEDQVANADNLSCYLPGGVDGRSLISTSVRLADSSSMYQDVPDPAQFPPERWLAAPSGRTLLAVVSGPQAPNAYLYQYRIDGSAWSRFRGAPNGRLEVSSPRLRMLGQHHIEVRARHVRDYTQLSAPQSVYALVDPERPTVTLHRSNNEVAVDVLEHGSPDDVEIWSRWSHPHATETETDSVEWQRSDTQIDITLMRGTLEVMARDAAGNTSEIASIALGDFSTTRPAAPDDAPATTSGCDSRGSGSTPTAWLGLGVAVMAALRRRWSKCRLSGAALSSKAPVSRCAGHQSTHG